MIKKKIVVVDDCTLHLELVRDILEPAGYEVLTADSSIAANSFIYTTPPPDLLLVDVEMPMLNGTEKVRLMKKRQTSCNIPMLLMSGKSPDEMKILADESGADGFLCKPFDQERLLQEVSRYL